MARKAAMPPAEVQARAREARGTRDLTAALAGPGVSIIAEIKRASPSKGPLRPDLDPVALARDYEAAQAAAISVLTEESFFRGSLDDLRAVCAAVSLPVLRKDFLQEEYEIWEARAAGADAVLLIAALLMKIERLEELLSLVRELGMSALVEVHDEAELARAQEAGARIIGINNRNLRTFAVDLAVTERLRHRIPDGRIMVSESGISSASHMQHLASLGIHAVLIGEALVKANNPRQALDTLVLAGRLT